MAFEMPTPQAGPQTDFLSLDDKEYLVFYGGAAGGGKALALNTKVLTPNGWSKVKDLHVGDEVIDSFGKRQKIVAEYPQPIKPLYEVKFRDGATITCCGEHLWSVNLAGKEYVKDTNYIKEWMERTNRNPTVPLYRPDENEDVFKDVNITIDPYLLGFLLGDGHFGKSVTIVSTADLEVIDYVHSLGYITRQHTSNPYDYTIKSLELRNQIRDLGLSPHKSDTKFIPLNYLNASFKTRKALLQGLLDSDGHRKIERYAAEYATVSKQLAEDFQYLVRSLGGTATLTLCEKTFTYNGEKKIGLPCYRFYVRLPDLNSFFRLKRKNEPEPARPKNRNSIVSIEHKGEGLSKCFTVTGERSEFVVENFIVTHNTFSLLLDCLKYIDCPDFYGVYFRSTTKQVERALWPLAKSLYFPFLIYHTGPNKGRYKGKAQIRERDKVIFFPSGAKVEFTYLDDLTVEENFQGAELTAAYFDEF